MYDCDPHHPTHARPHQINVPMNHTSSRHPYHPHSPFTVCAVFTFLFVFFICNSDDIGVETFSRYTRTYTYHIITPHTILINII